MGQNDRGQGGDGRLWIAAGCPICGSKDVWEFFSRFNTPTQDGVLWATKEEAIHSPVGDIRLAFCNSCSYIGNQVHEPGKVRFTGYDVSLQHSPLFGEFVGSLAERLIGSYGIRGKHVLDIACGTGHFLRTICRLGGNRGTGVDPSYAPDGGVEPAGEELTFLREFYGESHNGLRADLISVRHMIDLLADPKGLLRTIRTAAERVAGSLVYVEVPLAAYTFENRIVWNVVYEHRSWFTPESLQMLFEQCGFAVTRIAPCWRNEYLGIDARVAVRPVISPVNRTRVAATRGILQRFAESHEAVIATWRDRLASFARSGRKVAAWGAGARGITFLSTYNSGEVIPLIVDINPKRQGMYLPRTAHRVGAPDDLLVFRPDVLVITNPTYEKEIREHIASLGIAPEIVVL